MDLDGSHLGRRHPVDIGVVGDVDATLAALLARLPQRDDDSFLEECLEHQRKAIAREANHDKIGKGGAVHPQYLAETISRHAAPDAIYTADGGSPMAWCLRHIASTGRNRTVVSLNHGTMTNAMPQTGRKGRVSGSPVHLAVRRWRSRHIAWRPADCRAGKIADQGRGIQNSALDFVEIEQKVEGLLDTYTELVNPDFSRVAEVIGFYGQRVERGDDLEAAVERWLAEPGPALIDVVTDRFELVMPPKIKAGEVAGMALYSAKAVLHGRGEDITGMIRNLLA